MLYALASPMTLSIDTPARSAIFLKWKSFKSSAANALLQRNDRVH